jgi:hypothetical protein
MGTRVFRRAVAVATLTAAAIFGSATAASADAVDEVPPCTGDFQHNLADNPHDPVPSPTYQPPLTVKLNADGTYLYTLDHAGDVISFAVCIYNNLP